MSNREIFAYLDIIKGRLSKSNPEVKKAFNLIVEYFNKQELKRKSKDDPNIKYLIVGTIPVDKKYSKNDSGRTRVYDNNFGKGFLYSEAKEKLEIYNQHYPENELKIERLK